MAASMPTTAPPAGNATTAGDEVFVKGDHGRDVHALQFHGNAGHAHAAAVSVVALGSLAAAGRLEEVKQSVETEEAQQHGIDGADEELGQQRVGVVQTLVDGAADEGARAGTHEEGNSQFDGHVAQLLVHGRAHDGLGEDVEQVRTDGQNTLDAGSHESGRNDEAAARADTAGNQTRGQAHGDGGQEDGRRIEGGRIGGFAAQHCVGFIGFRTADQQDGRCQRQQDQKFFAVFDDGCTDFQIPFGIGLGAAQEKVVQVSAEAHNSSVGFGCRTSPRYGFITIFSVSNKCSILHNYLCSVQHLYFTEKVFFVVCAASHAWY